MSEKEIKVKVLHCDRCGHQWKPFLPPRDVQICPRCKSARWNQPKEKHE